MVAGRQIDRLVLRRSGEYALLHRRSGRQGHAARDQDRAAPASTTIRSGRPTARRSASPTTPARSTSSTSPSGASTKISSDVALRPGARARSHLVARLEVAGLHAQHADVHEPIHLYSVGREEVVPLTDGLHRRQPAGLRSERQVPLLPRLDRRRSGRRIGSRSRTPTCARRNSIYLAVLPKGVVSPLAKESDEEAAKSADESAMKPETKTSDKPADEKAARQDKSAASKTVTVVVDFDGLTQRIVVVADRSRRGYDEPAGRQERAAFLSQVRRRQPLRPDEIRRPAALRPRRSARKRRCSRRSTATSSPRDGKRCCCR